ncbi:sensor histidine kinase RegB [Aliiroseovarius sp. YM-037]|uniref:sensor histidine kinase RegB n=1 Tax=Aliiroseovarius sp. YM-037 TaxID=3341728 RepID=UPI003A8077A6
MTQSQADTPQTYPPSAVFPPEARADWLRLRTFTTLRWIAIVGQIAAITIAQRLYGLSMEVGFVYAVVAASVIANLVFDFVYPENKRLTEAQVVVMLLFDISQLSLLLFLTGGLHNPFALLIVAPVTISATALYTRSTVFLGVVALAATTILVNYHIPLRTEQGFILRMPQIFVFGFWVAIMIGIVFLGAYAHRVSSEIRSMSEAALATQMALAREQKLTDLGGVIAAAAHELGTPLATIKLISTELLEDLTEDDPLYDDAILIRDQSDRCREILRSMGRAGKDDLHLRSAPLSAVISEAAEPHLDRGKSIQFDFAPDKDGGPEPTIRRQPELIHGVRNLIQNAVDFATDTVWIEARWTESTIRLRVMDDGPGYPSHLLGRIGEPLMRRRRSASEKAQRPEYEGMGLGLFIAKTLLQRSGAELAFANGTDPSLRAEMAARGKGAVVSVTWPRNERGPEANARPGALGENQPIKA